LNSHNYDWRPYVVGSSVWTEPARAVASGYHRFTSQFGVNTVNFISDHSGGLRGLLLADGSVQYLRRDQIVQSGTAGGTPGLFIDLAGNPW
jgi:hypothetical protein